MDITNWNLVFKRNYYTKKIVETNLVYTPLINDEGTVFCMNFDHTHEYQNEMVSSFLPSRPHYNKETVEFFFNRELLYIEKFKDYPWAPKYLEIDKQNQRIYFEFNKESCNWTVAGEENLEEKFPNWEKQLINIIDDLIKANCYKLTIYPHCFYYMNGTLKMFDFYGCVDKDNTLVSLNRLLGILGVASPDRFEPAIKGDYVDTKELFIQALNGYSCWPTDRLKEFIPMIR